MHRKRKVQITSLLHSSAMTASMKSSSRVPQSLYWKGSGQQCKSHFRLSPVFLSPRRTTPCRWRYSPSHSLVDSPPIFGRASYGALKFQEYGLYFRLPITLSTFAFREFLIPLTFHPRS